ncbi:MAG: trimeric intracellular cation channel family protein [Cyclobacteriaceae bacterium]|nr:trimeric intracellular cation channel family protein [Cyclobacteriaceae bacterium]
MTLQYFFEIAGTYFFAMSGVVATEDKEQNWFGAAFTGFITAIGGGTLRDIILGNYPIFWVRDVNFIYAIILGVFTTFFFYQFIAKLKRTFLFLDMAGIGFFTIIGVEKALTADVSATIAAIMGMFTAVMGGVIRDTLTNTMPIIFRKEVYATACLAGAILYLVLNYFDVTRNLNLLISSGFIVIIRFLSIRFELALPTIKKH